MILLSLSNSKSPFVVSAILNFVGLVQYATICPKMSPMKKLLYAFVLSRLDHWNSLLAGCPKYLLYKKSKKYRTMLQDSFSEQPDLPTSLLCFILFTGCLLSRGSNTNCLCFALRSFLMRLPSTFQNFFTFTLLPGSSALLQTPKCSEYHPSEQTTVVSALSLTRLQLYGIKSLFLSAILPLSALLNLP